MKTLILAGMFAFACLHVQAQKYFNLPGKDTTALLNDSAVIETAKEDVADDIPTISLSDDDFKSSTRQNVSSQLFASRDPFYNAASFNFNVERFRLRGYDADCSSMFINGVSMNTLNNGSTPWNLWSGLNDVFKNRDVNIGGRYNTFGFGNIGTSTNIDVRASRQKKQTSFGYGLSNRNFTHAFSFTHNTGLLKRGWAFSLSANFRYANEGYIPGTFYNGASFFAAADKKMGEKHSFSIVLFGAPTINGRAGAATKEMMDLAATHYYNPSWGYQDGRKRNANVAKTEEPVIIATHEYRISNKTNLSSSASYSFGESSVSGIDWYNAPDPRPDYYRYLPSYYEVNDSNTTAQQVRSVLGTSEAARQIHWDDFYNINRDNTSKVEDANGISGNTINGNRSYYILGEKVTNVKRFTASTTLNTSIGNHINFTGGISFQLERNNYFQRVNDLLGGKFWVNLNPFAQRDFPNNTSAYQNDLDHPNRIVYKGDKYGYNYNININKPEEWAQFVFKYNKIDFYAAAEVSQTKFWRVGNVRNGLFPDASYGKSTINIFDNNAVKAGITYKLNGRNYFYVNGAVITRAPYYDDAFISPRTRDFVQSNLRNQNIQTGEAGYVLNAPRIKCKLSGYYTATQHGFNVMSFYSDDYQDFVNYALSNISKLYFGGEFGVDIKATQSLSFSAAASVGRYYYNSRQHAVVTVDNTAQALTETTVYSKNYRIAGTPQEAYNSGIMYRSPKFWFVSITGNYFRQMWLDFNPLRRTYLATDGVTNPNDAKAHAILDQTMLPSQYTIDFYGGYSWKIKHTHIVSARLPLFLSMNVGVNNVTNNKNIISGGYEQLRYDFSAPVNDNLKKFPPKFYYAYGLNYSINFQFHF